MNELHVTLDKSVNDKHNSNMSSTVHSHIQVTHKSISDHSAKHLIFPNFKQSWCTNV